MDPKASIEKMKSMYGVHIKDYAEEIATSSSQLDLHGGLYDENPILNGKRMTKINYH